MAKLNVEDFYLKEASLAKAELEKLGYRVMVKEISKPKIENSTMLVVKVTLKENNEVVLETGEFILKI